MIILFSPYQSHFFLKNIPSLRVIVYSDHVTLNTANKVYIHYSVLPSTCIEKGVTAENLGLSNHQWKVKPKHRNKTVPKSARTKTMETKEQK